MNKFIGSMIIILLASFFVVGTVAAKYGYYGCKIPNEKGSTYGELINAFSSPFDKNGDGVICMYQGTDNPDNVADCVTGVPCYMTDNEKGSIKLKDSNGTEWSAFGCKLPKEDGATYGNLEAAFGSPFDLNGDGVICLYSGTHHAPNSENCVAGIPCYITDNHTDKRTIW